MQNKIVITEKNIKKHLPESTRCIPFYIYDTVGSTNDVAKELAGRGEKNGIVIAFHQTAGRGRRGRSFFSPDGYGIYMSLLIHTEECAESVALITSAAATAIAEAIESVCKKHTDIKWINDIYIDGKKACGILCESLFSGNAPYPEYTVVGIGINLISPNGFPEDIADIATSIFGGDIPDENVPSKLCAEIIKNLFEYTGELTLKTFLNGYKERLFMLGHEITVHTPDGSYMARATDIDDECHLIVTLPNGEKRVLSSGEISIKI